MLLLRTDTLNNVPAGTYNLYLYGINNTGTRGTIFTVSTPVMAPVTLRAPVTHRRSLTNFHTGRRLRGLQQCGRGDSWDNHVHLDV